ncbi:MAG: hypothetical protein LBD59_12500 [Prevotellaceae bacterium]|jgi:hypothetical protein|nr:hypothetical protein [Prevotellaceae bacterium]
MIKFIKNALHKENMNVQRATNKKKMSLLGLIVMVMCVISSGIFMQSCNSSEEDVFYGTLNIPEQYNEVGKLHNEGLDFIFEELKAYAIEYTKNPRLKGGSFMDNKEEFVKQATLKFCKQNKKLSGSVKDFEHILDKPTISLKSIASASPESQNLLNEIEAIVRTKFRKKDIPDLKRKLDAINQQAARVLSENEAAAIYCATSTGYNSCLYWNENYKKWYFALNYPEILEQYNDKELNQLQMKNGQIRTKSLWSNMWNTVEDWWGTVSSAVEDWWNDWGAEMVLEDAKGALGGAITTGNLGGAIAGGLVGSAKEVVEELLGPLLGVDND